VRTTIRYQASGGRVAFAILAAAAGAGVSTGSESGFASLVDLKTGEIVWFNVVASGSGELRDEQGAVTAVETLFKDIPTN
jgi:outer membrane protein assembly factor BamB